jgi:transmembrane sensor
MNEPLPAAVEQAIGWLAQQRSGSFDADDQQRLHAWLAAAPEHGAAWDQLHARLRQTFAPLHETPASRALRKAPQSRRSILRGALGLGAMGMGAHLLSQPGLPLASLAADLSTGRGQRAQFKLPDGSQVLLNARSAIDVQFDADQRRLRLLQGALLVDAQPGTQPLCIDSPYGGLSLAAGRCSVALHDGYAHAWVLQGNAQLRAQNGAGLLLAQGQGARFDGHGIQPLARERIGEGAWNRGLLELHDRPLAELLDALRPYHRGWLHVSASAAALRISGVFTLDHSERVLASLADILPLRIERRFGWWTQVDHA